MHHVWRGRTHAICGVSGAYAEHVPVIHLVGMPASGVQAAHRLVHHTLGNGEFGLFSKMAEPVVCAQAIMTPDNCVAETERVIAAALYHRRPVYMGFPSDYANMPVVAKADPVVTAEVRSRLLCGGCRCDLGCLFESNTACILPGIIVARSGCERGDRGGRCSGSVRDHVHGQMRARRGAAELYRHV